MRTTDFSRAPAIGQASAQFVGGTKFSGLRAFFELAERWRPLVRRMKRSPGYRGHEMRAIEQFSPLAREVQGPAVPPDRIGEARSRPSDRDATVSNR